MPAVSENLFFVARFLGRRPFTPLFAPTLHRRRRVLMETGSRSCVPSPTTGPHGDGNTYHVQLEVSYITLL